MTTLGQLLASPMLAPDLGYLTRPRVDPPVRGVALIEELGDMERIPERAVVLLTRGVSAHVGTYRFDVVLRLARSREAAAVVVSGVDATRITPTSAAIADRSGTAILGARAGADLAELAIAIARVLAGDGGLALLRAHAAVRTIAAHPADGDDAALVRRAGSALGVPLELVSTEPDAGAASARITADDHPAWVTAAPQDGDMKLALEVVLHTIAASIADAVARRDRAEDIPIQSVSEALAELLVAGQAQRPAVVQRTRALGVRIDGWHVAVRVELDDLSGAPTPVGDGALAGRALVLTALRALRQAGATWYS
ncbi:MAG: hypothetical protein QOE86_2337, partial [Solirubrobacteraceae bacterium]|nr:hypothetical protein [Solirubrobacteraceae bacterium]